jgi:hypothetical protein
VLLSDTTRAIVADDLPEGVRLRSLGERPLRDIERPEPLSELVIPDVTVSEGRPDELEADRKPVPATPELPTWVLGPAKRFLPGGSRTGDLIERRVLDAINDAFEQSSARHADRLAEADQEPHPTPPVPSAPGSMADEIDRLRALRDAGALTEEQYARAVDRIVGGS